MTKTGEANDLITVVRGGGYESTREECKKKGMAFVQLPQLEKGRFFPSRYFLPFAQKNKQ